jgi:hypothetical protein
MALGSGPYGAGTPPSSESTEPAVALASSRKIDFRTGRYVLDANGNFEEMPDLHQRVGLLIAYGVKEPEILGPTFKAELEAQIRSALKPLTEARPPEAVIKRIEISTAAGNSYCLIAFTNGAVVKVPRA